MSHDVGRFILSKKFLLIFDLCGAKRKVALSQFRSFPRIDSQLLNINDALAFFILADMSRLEPEGTDQELLLCVDWLE
jgi:hypothetical protein